MMGPDPDQISYLLPEDGLWLTTETLLLSVVTPPTLGEFGLLRLLVLSHLELLVLFAGTAKSVSGFWHIHLQIPRENLVSKMKRISRLVASFARTLECCPWRSFQLRHQLVRVRKVKNLVQDFHFPRVNYRRTLDFRMAYSTSWVAEPSGLSPGRVSPFLELDRGHLGEFFNENLPFWLLFWRRPSRKRKCKSSMDRKLAFQQTISKHRLFAPNCFNLTQIIHVRLIIQ